ncbi:FAD-dependent oxidoreductase, partial [Candidatus Bathyarchaeota archaeon]|nr:FAD-dependent oxidoreductase [Candidatus Bathyarchaeota archaeon]
FSTEWYKQKAINVNLNKKVTKINLKKKEVSIQNYSNIKYDKLLLANGGHSFFPPINNWKISGIFTLRTMNDAIKIKNYAKKSKKTVIIGGGLLGLEFASSLKKLGQQVTVIELNSRLLPKQLDIEGAAFLKKHFMSKGIDIKLNSKTTEFIGKRKVSGILLNNGEKIQGDLILVCAGMKPNIKLAYDAGIQTNRGIVIDKFLKTSANEVYAVGDVSEFKKRTYGIIPAALDQSKIVASNILENEPKIYSGTVANNTLKIVDIALSSMGTINPEKPYQKEIMVKNERNGIYKKLVLDHGKIIGAILLGSRKGATTIKKIITQKIDITKYKDSILKEDFNYKKIINST